MVEQNVSLPTTASTPSVATELMMGNITLRFYNGADEQVVQSTLRCIGGINHA
jgi:hypothetical protein